MSSAYKAEHFSGCDNTCLSSNINIMKENQRTIIILELGFLLGLVATRALANLVLSITLHTIVKFIGYYAIQNV